MIIDHISRWRESLDWLQGGELFFDYLEKALRKFPEEDSSLLGEDGARALVSSYTPEKKATLWEAHRKYYDLQFLVSGREGFGWAPLARLTEEIPYDEKKDIAFYRGPGDEFLFREGYFILLGPHEGHRPGLFIPGQVRVKKIVIKIPLALISRERAKP